MTDPDIAKNNRKQMSRLLIHTEPFIDPTGSVDDVVVLAVTENDDGTEKTIFSGFFSENETHEEIKKIVSHCSNKNIPVVFDSVCHAKWSKFAGSNAQSDDSVAGSFRRKALVMLIMALLFHLILGFGCLKVIEYLQNP